MRLLSTHETRQRLGCGNTKLHQLFNEGSLPRVKLGARTMVPEKAVDEFIAALPRVEPAPRGDRRPAPAAAE